MAAEKAVAVTEAGDSAAAATAAAAEEAGTVEMEEREG